MKNSTKQLIQEIKIQSYLDNGLDNQQAVDMTLSEVISILEYFEPSKAIELFYELISKYTQELNSSNYSPTIGTILNVFMTSKDCLEERIGNIA